MKERINDWVNEAFSLATGDPNQDIIKLGEKYKSDMTPDMLNRVVQNYNVKTFLDKQASGFDMEQDFPIADPVKVIAGVFKNILSSKSVSNQDTSPKKVHTGEDLYKMSFVKEASNRDSYYTTLPPVTQYKEIPKPSINAEELYKTAAAKVSDYVHRLGKMGETFKAELRYLYPDNTLLGDGIKKEASEGPFHQEFKQVNKMWNLLKVAAMTSKEYADLVVKQQELEEAQKELKLVQNVKDLENELHPDRILKLKQVKDLEYKQKKLQDEQNQLQLVQDVKDLEEELHPDRILKLKNKYKEFVQKRESNKERSPLGRNIFDKTTLFSGLDLIGNVHENLTSKKVDFLVPPTAVIQNTPFNPTHLVAELGKVIQDMPKKFPLTARDNMEKAMRTIMHKANFDNLLEKDVTLQGSDPAKLLNQYRTAVQVAPSMMADREIAKIFLRNANLYSQGGVDPDTIKQLVLAENMYNKNPEILRALSGGRS